MFTKKSRVFPPFGERASTIDLLGMLLTYFSYNASYQNIVRVDPP